MWTIQSMGQILLSQSTKIQNMARSFFWNVDLVWKDGFKHKSQNKVAMELAYIAYVHVFEFS